MNAAQILEDLEEVKNGAKKVTMIMEDPFGHSVIVDEAAVKSGLSEEEIKKLKTGFTTFENEELELDRDSE